MLSQIQIGQYLDRLSLSTVATDKMELLSQLQLAHLRSVPFENLDISLGNSINLEPTDIFNKLITKRRGGFCYELNFLFYQLLVSFGFKVEMISAVVYGDKDFGPEFDHLLLLVSIEDNYFIADVGFGDSFLTPVGLDGQVVDDGRASYKVVNNSGELTLYKQEFESGTEQLESSNSWQPQYRFTLEFRKLSDFEGMCRYQQESADSHFTQKTICTILTTDGRKTLSNNRLIVTANGEKYEEVIRSLEAYLSLLNEVFSITLDANNAKLSDKFNWFQDE